MFLNSNPYFSPQTWAQEVQIWEALVQGPGTSWKCALAPPVGKGGIGIHKYKSTTVRSFLHTKSLPFAKIYLEFVNSFSFGLFLHFVCIA